MIDDILEDGEDDDEDIDISPDSQEKIDEYATPFPVIIGEDCREPNDYGLAGNLTGYQGVCLGYYGFSENFRRLDELRKLTSVAQVGVEGGIKDANPLIYVPKVMEYIWGGQCNFARLEKSGPIKPTLDKIQEILAEGKDPRNVNWDEMPF